MQKKRRRIICRHDVEHEQVHTWGISQFHSTASKSRAYASSTCCRLGIRDLLHAFRKSAPYRNVAGGDSEPISNILQYI